MDEEFVASTTTYVLIKINNFIDTNIFNRGLLNIADYGTALYSFILRMRAGGDSKDVLLFFLWAQVEKRICLYAW